MTLPIHDVRFDVAPEPEPVPRTPVVFGNTPRVHRLADPTTKAARQRQRAARKKSR